MSMASFRQAIYTTLVAESDVTDLVSTRIYSTFVPQDTATPYLLISLNSGGDTNQTQTPEVDMTFTVKVVASSMANAETGSDAIRTALREAALSGVGNWTFYRCQTTTQFYFVEQVEHGQLWHSGWNVRVRGMEAIS